MPSELNANGHLAEGYLEVTNYRDNSKSRTIKFTPTNSTAEYVNTCKNDGTWVGWDSHALNSDLTALHEITDFGSITVSANSAIEVNTGLSSNNARGIIPYVSYTSSAVLHLSFSIAYSSSGWIIGVRNNGSASVTTNLGATLIK